MTATLWFSELWSISLSGFAEMLTCCYSCVLVLARAGLILAVARKGVANTRRLFYTTSHHFPGIRRGSLLSQAIVVCCHWYCYCSFFNLIVISYLNLWLLPFVPPILLSSSQQGTGRGKGVRGALFQWEH